MTDAKSIVSETSSLDDTDDLELQQRLEKIEREIAELTFENTLFETTLERKTSQPQVQDVSSSAAVPVNSSQTTTPTGLNHELTISSAASRGDRLARKRSKSRSTQGDFRIPLTLEQKLDIATSEYEQTKNEKIRCERTNEKDIDQLESDREWIDAEIIDCELSITDFLKIKDSSIDKRTHQLIGEKIDRYFIERIKARESLINKLHDRSSGFKRQIIRVENRLREKEEMGDTLQEIDFDQLKIENKQFLDKIDEKNVDLVLLKREVVKITRIFNHYKDDLHTKTQDLIDLQKRIDKQQSLYEYIQQEMITANYEQTRATKKHYHLVEQTTKYRVPEILDYVRKKALLYNLQRDCEVWQRKVELVLMGFQQAKQAWQTLQRTARYSYNADKWNNTL